MKIRLYPDPVLRIRSDEVKEGGKTLKNIIKQMLSGMKLEEGIGLAANQIGITQRIIVLDMGETQTVMLNPVLKSASKEKESQFEGCLSFPNLSVAVERSREIDIEFMNTEFKLLTMHLEGINARAFQHELDHLNGVLIIDYAPPEERFNYNIYITKEKENHVRS
ncbi:MAG: peptide deformylase [bacterium]|nr:peptide deformylase [bacterium]